MSAINYRFLIIGVCVDDGVWGGYFSDKREVISHLVDEAESVGIEEVVSVACGVLLPVADHPLHQLLVPRLTAVVAVASRRTATSVRVSVRVDVIGSER